tara:strand:- start:288 stop:410 length:123 start_codon:yes stop_codon:yes gene_type:complete
MTYLLKGLLDYIGVVLADYSVDDINLNCLNKKSATGVMAK